MRYLLIAVAACAVLAGCGTDAHKGQHCVESHTYTYYVNGACLVTQKIGQTSYCSLYQQIPITSTDCDQWAPDDPSTATKDN